MPIFDLIRGKIFNGKFPMVALDLAETSLELIQLAPKPGKPKIAFAYRQELKPGLIKNCQIIDSAGLAGILKEIWQANKLKNKNCLLSLPDKIVYFANLKIADKTGDLQAAIMAKAGEILPLDLSDYFFDYRLVETGKNSQEFFFIAAEKKIIRQYFDLCQAAGLNLAVLDFESACLARSLLKDNKEPCFVLDLGGYSTDLFLVDCQGFRYQVNFAVGGSVLDKKIAETLQINLKQAEKIKKQKGAAAIEDSVLFSIFEPVFLEIQKIAADYENKNKQPVKKIILAGGTSLLKGLLKKLRQKFLSWQIELGDPAQKVDLAGKLKSKDIILYSNAIGLALRGLDKDSLAQGINLLKDINK
ncbi:MAG TPA: hypothetical protein ENN28_01070 [Candidatus Uhrbacteria bacterium]|nr:hypothetical protein [Candidatus Uhrbacteria bacterium]